MGIKRTIYGLPIMSSYRSWRSSVLATQSRPHPLGFVFAGAESFFSDSWEPAERAAFEAQIASADLFVDVGANQGIYSCWAASKGLAVVAIEPERSNLRFLLNNVKANNFGIEVFPLALARRPGVAEFFGDGVTASLMPGWASARASFAQLVPTNTLDTILAGRRADARIFIKVDVEGFELEVLRSAEQILGRDPAPAWMIETFPLHYNAERSPNPGFANLFAIMRRHGYRGTRIGTGEIATEALVDAWVRDAAAYDSSKSNFLFEKA